MATSNPTHLNPAQEFDEQLSAIPLYTERDGQLIHNPERDAFIERWVKEHRIRLAGPLRARALGCCGLSDGDNLRHLNQDVPRRCLNCPVTRKLRNHQRRLWSGKC